MDFREICCCGLLREFVEKIQIGLQTGKNIGHATKTLFKFRNGPILDQLILFPSSLFETFVSTKDGNFLTN